MDLLCLLGMERRSKATPDHRRIFGCSNAGVVDGLPGRYCRVTLRPGNAGKAQPKLGKSADDIITGKDRT